MAPNMPVLSIASQAVQPLWLSAVSKDHVNVFVSAPPNMVPSEIMRKIKGRTSSKLLEEVPHLKKRYWGRHLWANPCPVISFTASSLNSCVYFFLFFSLNTSSRILNPLLRKCPIIPYNIITERLRSPLRGSRFPVWNYDHHLDESLPSAGYVGHFDPEKCHLQQKIAPKLDVYPDI
jgi:hypothetical protein